MSILVTGYRGLLGKALTGLLADGGHFWLPYPYRLEEPIPASPMGCELAFLCAGTKGFAECEGNRAAFRADVDGNIRLARHLLHSGTFVVFVSTDAVEVAAGAAYARNRLLVELAIGGEPNCAIFRPGRFGPENVIAPAKELARVGLERRAGLTRWPDL